MTLHKWWNTLAVLGEQICFPKINLVCIDTEFKIYILDLSDYRDGYNLNEFPSSAFSVTNDSPVQLKPDIITTDRYESDSLTELYYETLTLQTGTYVIYSFSTLFPLQYRSAINIIYRMCKCGIGSNRQFTIYKLYSHIYHLHQPF